MENTHLCNLILISIYFPIHIFNTIILTPDGLSLYIPIKIKTSMIIIPICTRI